MSVKPWKKICLRTEPRCILRKRCILLEGHLLDFICGNGRLEGMDFFRPKDPKRLEKHIRHVQTANPGAG